MKLIRFCFFIHIHDFKEKFTKCKTGDLPGCIQEKHIVSEIYSYIRVRMCFYSSDTVRWPVTYICPGNITGHASSSHTRNPLFPSNNPIAAAAASAFVNTT